MTYQVQFLRELKAHGFLEIAMKTFTKGEIIGISLILLVVFVATAFNLQIAIRRARDAQRREDLGNIADSLEQFQADFGFFPPAVGGHILACEGDNFKEISLQLQGKKQFDRDLFFQGLRACEWGTDSFKNLLNNMTYLATIPGDSKYDEGISYYYMSNSKRYQIYAYLEGENDETGYNIGIASRNLPCANYVCNFGKAYGATPVDQSIEDYENLLIEKTKVGE